MCDDDMFYDDGGRQKTGRKTLSGGVNCGNARAIGKSGDASIPPSDADSQLSELLPYLTTHFPETCRELEGQRIVNVAMQVMDRLRARAETAEDALGRKICCADEPPLDELKQEWAERNGALSEKAERLLMQPQVFDGVRRYGGPGATPHSDSSDVVINDPNGRR